VSKFDNKILKTFIKNSSGYIKGISNNKYPFMRRQDLPKVYMGNGAIYIVIIDDFIKNNSFYTEKTTSYLMSNLKSIDIDEELDIELTARHLKSQNK
jgi:CMP-N,N'-diacetyllegionaminic acid synthase